MQVERELQFRLDLHTGRPLTESEYTRCCISTISPPHDEHDVAQIIERTVINVLQYKVTVRQVGHLQELVRIQFTIILSVNVMQPIPFK